VCSRPHRPIWRTCTVSLAACFSRGFLCISISSSIIFVECDLNFSQGDSAARRTTSRTPAFPRGSRWWWHRFDYENISPRTMRSSFPPEPTNPPGHARSHSLPLKCLFSAKLGTVSERSSRKSTETISRRIVARGRCRHHACRRRRRAWSCERLKRAVLNCIGRSDDDRVCRDVWSPNCQGCGTREKGEDPAEGGVFGAHSLASLSHCARKPDRGRWIGRFRRLSWKICEPPPGFDKLPLSGIFPLHFYGSIKMSFAMKC
jgi:hypothetical protein